MSIVSGVSPRDPYWSLSTNEKAQSRSVGLRAFYIARQSLEWGLITSSTDQSFARTTSVSSVGDNHSACGCSCRNSASPGHHIIH